MTPPNAKRQTDRYARSHAAFEKASSLIPGGVNSPARSYKPVDGEPIFIREGSGCRLIDVDGNRYIDYVSSYGPLIVGHAHPAVVAAVTKAASRGTSFGMPTEAETQLAKTVVDAVPSIDLVRFVNSGTEATMSAIRLARGATGRPKVVKCVGGYHGHVDSLLIQAGSGATSLGVPSSPGVPDGQTADVLLVPYNDLDTARETFAEHGHEIAALILEPVAGNMGCVPPAEGYLHGLREICDEHGSLLIFDEVMTGFRVAYGGAQSFYGVTPDLTTLGKIVGGGLPCAAFGGRRQIMEQIAPAGPVYQAGTLSGNPVAMAAGVATLELLREPGVYQQLERAGERLEKGLREAADQAGVAIRLNRVASMLTPFFCDHPVRNYDDATAADTDAFKRFFAAMLEEGVTLAPSQYEAWFVSLAHDDDAIDQTVAAAEKAFAAAKESA